MSLALIVAFVLSPSLFACADAVVARGGPSPRVAEGVDVKSDVVRREPNPERAQ